MNKYRVPASMITCLYLEVSAESEEEALAIADETDGEDFIREEGFGSTDWRMGDPILLEEDIEGDEE